MIIDGIARREENESKEPVVVECIDHLQFAQQKCEQFNGRQDFLETLKEMTTNK